MNCNHTSIKRLCMVGLVMSLSVQCLYSQTDLDAVMLKKNLFCVGGMYSHNSWKDYWEGKFKRDNQNIGTVTTHMFGVMGAYGVTNKINVMFSVPYVAIKKTAGPLRALDGIQDLSLMVKWMPFVKQFGPKNRISVFGIGKISFPVSDYVVDHLPLSIGLRSKTAGIRAMVDYQYGKLFATASGAYTYRSNIDIDRNAYYTTEMHYTNEVKMPDVSGYNVRAGYRTARWIAEGVVENMTTLGGFDIRKNDMPFPSNKMNMTQVGVNFKHTMTTIKGLELTAGGRYVVKGRNVGQAMTIYGGIFYLMNLSSSKNISTNINN